MERNAAPPGESEESNVGGTQAYQRLKPNSVGLIAVVFGHIVYEDTTERSGSDTSADSRGDRATGARAT